MPNYLVLERVPDATYSQGYPKETVPNYGAQCVTLVEAESPEKAVQLVIGATRRVGQYAVVEAQFVSFLPDETSTVEDGILRGKSDTRQLNGGDHGGQ